MGNRSSINNVFVDKVDEIVEKMTSNFPAISAFCIGQLFLIILYTISV